MKELVEVAVALDVVRVVGLRAPEDARPRPVRHPGQVVAGMSLGQQVRDDEVVEHARQRVLRCQCKARADPYHGRRALHEHVARDLERAVHIRMLDRLEGHKGLASSLIRSRLVVRPV